MITKISTFFVVATAAAITAGAAAGVSLARQADATARPVLTGQWQLNPELSEDAQEKLQSMGGPGGDAGRGGHGPGRGAGAGRGGHGPGQGGSGGIFGGGRSEEQMRAQMEEARSLILNAPTRFILTQDDEKVVLTEPDGRVRTLPTNNRRVKVDGRDVRTKWENNRLVSETSAGNVKIVETYEPSPGAPHVMLYVTARMEMRGQQVSVRRVYDAVPD